ncbi:hypothetical protein [Methylobacillus glycogenes]|uniref:hypothetical protein n=1 Tax=Methylobacillus glycogenes TaxID=406 RepID=UPI00046F870F|nr:hypothetical protein [Methylobacillus glycogenes]
MVIALNILIQMINARNRKVLTIAEASMHPSQFKAFRKLFFNEYGEKGLEGELQKIYTDAHKQQGKGRE